MSSLSIKGQGAIHKERLHADERGYAKCEQKRARGEGFSVHGRTQHTATRETHQEMR